MLKLLITKFWPVIIPIIIYLIWRFCILPRIKTKKEEKHLLATYMFIIGCITTLIISLLLFFFSENSKKTRFYTPAKIEKGQIKPAIIE